MNTPPARRTPDLDRLGPWLPVALLVVYAIVLVRTAWVCDDAYITFRTVDNLIHGQGLGWNVLERVQAYTHPLWMLVMSGLALVTRDVFYTSIVTTAAMSIAALTLLAFPIAGGWRAGALVLLVAAFSKAYVDFSTSGMENALTHLLLAVFLWIYLRRGVDVRSLFQLTLVTSLVYLSRPDALLLLLPALAERTWRLWRLRGHPALVAVLAGLVPLAAWEIFSLLYYGFPFPNTAYAKLTTGIPAGALLRQGFIYLVDSWRMDPITPIVIVGGLGLAFARRQGGWIGAGVLVYLVYVVKIGGDFMSGRFLTAPLLISLALAAVAGGPWLAHAVRRQAVVAAAAVLAIVVVGCLGVDVPPLSGADYGVGRSNVWNGIEDGRAYYYATASLLNARRGTPMPARDTAALGRSLRARVAGMPPGRFAYVTRASIGYFGYESGPRVHIIDQYGLADPLLARLPLPRGANWRIGHFQRPLPEGYKESLMARDNRLADPDLARYYDALRNVVRGPIWSGRRLRDIWALNTGGLDHLVARHAQRHAARAGSGD
jgi:arabinofuranosyltransferase